MRRALHRFLPIPVQYLHCFQHYIIYSKHFFLSSYTLIINTAFTGFKFQEPQLARCLLSIVFAVYDILYYRLVDTQFGKSAESVYVYVRAETVVQLLTNLSHIYHNRNWLQTITTTMITLISRKPNCSRRGTYWFICVDQVYYWQRLFCKRIQVFILYCTS